MSKNIPDYLKLHTEEFSGPPTAGETLSGLTELCDAFASATGWRLRQVSASDDAATPPRIKLALTEEPDTIKYAGSRPGGVATAATAKEHAERLIASINSLLSDLQDSAYAIWQREAELAAGVPVTPRADENEHLAERLETVLQGGVEAVGGVAGGLYLLDEATSHLKLRATWGLPRKKLLEPPRPLRGAVADLEALVGHAVVLEDTSLLPHWKVPEPFPSAVCIPVATPTTPLGTLWVFADRRRDFSERETNILEIVAGRLASELEREMLLVEGVAARQWKEQVVQAAQRLQQRLPTFAPDLDAWELAAWATTPQTLSGEYYDWGVLTDGRPYVALGAAEGPLLDAALSSAGLHSAMKSQLVHPHSPRQLLERINEILWTGSAGDQFASLWYGTLEPDSGICQYAFAGRLRAIVVSGRGTRPLTHPAALLGLGPDTAFPVQKAVVQRDEALILASGGVFSIRDAQGEPLRDEELGAALRDAAPGAPAQELVDRLRSFLLTRAHGDDLPECTIVVVRRKA